MMLTNEELDALLRNPVRQMPILLRLISQAREANELRALREQTREITLLAARKLEEARQYRRDHDAMNVLRESCTLEIVRSGKQNCIATNHRQMCIAKDPADALLAWAEKFGTQETAK